MNEILKKRIEEGMVDYAHNLYPKYFPQHSIARAAFHAGAEYALSHQFISVKEALPEYDESVIVAFGDYDYALLHRSNNSNVLTDKNGFCNYGYKEVLAWMPIPKFETKK